MKSQDVTSLAEVLIEIGSMVHELNMDLEDEKETNSSKERDLKTMSESKASLQKRFDENNERRQKVELRLDNAIINIQELQNDLRKKKRQTKMESYIYHRLSILRNQLEGSVMTDTANRCHIHGGDNNRK